jgi:hypothetical protein
MSHTCRLGLVVGATSLLGLAACGQQTLDTTKAEGVIAQGISQQTGAQGVTVDCPSDVKIEQGNEFECRARTAKGDQAPVKVRQTDDKGGVSWELDAK